MTTLPVRSLTDNHLLFFLSGDISISNADLKRTTDHLLRLPSRLSALRSAASQRGLIIGSAPSVPLPKTAYPPVSGSHDISAFAHLSNGEPFVFQATDDFTYFVFSQQLGDRTSIDLTLRNPPDLLFKTEHDTQIKGALNIYVACGRAPSASDYVRVVREAQMNPYSGDLCLSMYLSPETVPEHGNLPLVIGVQRNAKLAGLTLDCSISVHQLPVLPLAQTVTLMDSLYDDSVLPAEESASSTDRTRLLELLHSGETLLEKHYASHWNSPVPAIDPAIANDPNICGFCMYIDTVREIEDHRSVFAKTRSVFDAELYDAETLRDALKRYLPRVATPLMMGQSPAHIVTLYVDAVEESRLIAKLNMKPMICAEFDRHVSFDNMTRGCELMRYVPSQVGILADGSANYNAAHLEKLKDNPKYWKALTAARNVDFTVDERKKDRREHPEKYSDIDLREKAFVDEEGKRKWGQSFRGRPNQGEPRNVYLVPRLDRATGRSKGHAYVVFVTQTFHFNAINPNQFSRQFEELQSMVDDSVKRMQSGRGHLYTVKAAHQDRLESRLSKARAASSEHAKRVKHIAEGLELGGTIEGFGEDWNDEERYQDNDDAAILKEDEAEESKKEQAVAMADKLTDDEMDEDEVKGPDDEQDVESEDLWSNDEDEEIAGKRRLQGVIDNGKVDEEESSDEDEGMVSLMSQYFGKAKADKRQREDVGDEDEVDEDAEPAAKRRKNEIDPELAEDCRRVSELIAHESASHPDVRYARILSGFGANTKNPDQIPILKARVLKALEHLGYDLVARPSDKMKILRRKQ